MKVNRYIVGDYVVLNDKFIPKGSEKLFHNCPYFENTIVEVIESDGSSSLYYEVQIPAFLGEFASVYVDDTYINHEASAKLNKDKL